MASHGRPIGRSNVPALIYRAEAYEEGDGFRDPRWDCGHEHKTVETALQCGQEWLSAQSDPLTETA